MIAIDSQVTAVTVFSDRALITRRGNIKLEVGEQKVFFDNLPEAIEEKSIRMTGEGDATLQNIKLYKEHFSADQNQTVRDLKDQLKALNDKCNEKQTVIDLSEKEYNLLDKIIEKITSPSKTTDTGELNPDSWIQMITFYRKKLEELELQKTSSKIEIEKINSEINKINSDIYQLDSTDDKTRNRVEVSLEMENPGEMILELSYMVYGPRWYPVYDMRVSTEEKAMNLTYNAMVLQSTSEDWSDVILKLSTAKPHVDGTIPQLVPWNIEEYHAPIASSQPFGDDPFLSMSAESSSPEPIGKLKKARARSIPSKKYSVESQGTSVIFNPSGSNTVLSDNTPYKVTILINDFPAKFKYSAVPKLTAFTYLKAKVKNTSEFQLLAGECNIFMDNNFVANSSIKNISTEEEFWVSLGIDESLPIERKFIRKYEKKEGLLAKKTKFIYEYIFVIENKRDSEEKLILQDQIPITGHQDIIVELIAPVLGDKSGELLLDSQNILEWNLTLLPFEKREIDYKFSVEYPKTMEISGL